MKRNAILRMQGISKRYGAREPVVVLNDAHLEVFPGEIVAIMGASGSGKTTLLSIASSLDSDYSGDVELLGVTLQGISQKRLDAMRRKKLGFLLQRPFLIQEMTSIENVALAATISGMPHHRAQKVAQGLLAAVCLEPHAWAQKPAVLSPGEAQRVALARALVHTPQFVVCDEPTASLDKATGASVMDMLCELVRKSRSSVLVATHDDNIAQRCDRVLVLDKGWLS